MTSPGVAHPSAGALLAPVTSAVRYAEPGVLAPIGRRSTPAVLASPRRPGRSQIGRGAGGAPACRCSAPQISAEELTILRHGAEGLPIASVAQRVGTSPRTVRRRM